MTVTIHIEAANAEEAQVEMARLLGSTATVPAEPFVPEASDQPGPTAGAAAPEETKPEPQKPAKPEEKPAPVSGGRKFGESDPDKARRTKEQMATDKEIEELAAALGVAIDSTVPADRLIISLREASAAAGKGEQEANISSSPEDRKDPDEIGAATREDVREMMAKCVEKFGMAWMQKEGPKMLGAGKLSEIPDEPAAFAKAIMNLSEALDG